MKTKTCQVTLVAALVLGGMLVCSPVTAQAKGRRHQTAGTNATAKARFKGVAQELNLTAEQRQQLKGVLQDQAQKLQKLKADTGLAKRQKHAQLKQIRQDTLTKIKAILTPEQMEQWQKLRAQKGGQHQGKRGKKTKV